MSEEDTIVKLPPFKNEQIMTSFTQSVDWGEKLLNIPSTWKVTKGHGIVVAVLDPGCPARIKDGKVSIHQDLKNNILIDKCKSMVPNEDIYDMQGHSTACAGVIAAEDNLLGLVGYAPEAKIITYKVLSKSGAGSIKWVEAGLRQAIRDKPDIVSMSLGSPMGSFTMHQLVKKLDDMGIPVICAAGNSGAEVGVEYPAKYKESFAIGAFDETRKIADFSARGDEIDFVFPGVNISTTWLNDGYTRISGTSFACPACAGLVALLIAKHRDQEKRTGKNDCKTTADIYAHLKKYAVNPEVAGNHDSDWGWGYVDVNRMFEINEARMASKCKTTLWGRIVKFVKRLFGR